MLSFNSQLHTLFGKCITKVHLAGLRVGGTMVSFHQKSANTKKNVCWNKLLPITSFMESLQTHFLMVFLLFVSKEEKRCKKKKNVNDRKVSRPAFGCTRHLVAGWSTQHVASFIVHLGLPDFSDLWYIFVTVPYLKVTFLKLHIFQNLIIGLFLQ